MEPEKILYDIGERIDAAVKRGEDLDDELIAFVDTTYALVAQMYALIHKKEGN